MEKELRGLEDQEAQDRKKLLRDVRSPGQRVSDSGTADFSNGILNFNVPQTAQNGNTILNVIGNANVTGTTINLDTPSGRPDIAVGQGLTLLDVSGTLTGATTMTVQTASGDVYTVQVDANNPRLLQAVLASLSPTGPAYERLKAFAEGRAASLAFANQGMDFILNRGFGSALAATAGQGFSFGSFGGIGGGWSRYATGSHVDVSGTSLLAGLALGNDIAYGRLTLGAFFEGGWGNYTSHNSFFNAASVKGNGDTSYMGGGVLGRYDVTSGVLSGFYADASARIGRSKMDFNTDDIQYNGNEADFDSSALYYGLHGGLGYLWNITDRANLDFSAKLLWTRQEGDSLTVHQDRVKFQDADSIRTRLGGRLNYTVNSSITPYAGAYWEHEFDGKSRSTVNGNRIDTVSLRGDTGMGELGFTLKPSATIPLSFDLGVQGYVGKREGVTGSLQAKFEF